MPGSPLSQSPYEVLGVEASASQDELRRAYRRMLRQTHPDTGGDASRFNAVQQAWEAVGTPSEREAYDRGRPTRGSGEQRTWSTSASGERQQDSRPKARAYGHPGGWRRERYLGLIREWAGRGSEIPDPYDPALVRSAPREIRHILADALAEEATARTLAELGIGFTVWHDVATGDPEEKIDHVVLGPTGLFALLSEDFGGEVKYRRNELIGDAVGPDQPFASLSQRARRLGRSMRVKFTGLIIVLPDDALDAPFVELGSSRGARQLAVRQSVLSSVLRSGMADLDPVGGNVLFDVRSKLQAGIRFV